MPIQFTRVTVNLKPQAVTARDRLIERNGINQTDAISRALLIADRVEQAAGEGAQVRLRYPDGREVDIIFV